MWYSLACNTVQFGVWTFGFRSWARDYFVKGVFICAPNKIDGALNILSKITKISFT